MATTRKTAAKAEQLRISQIGDFKDRVGGVIELPSGLIIRWRNPGGLRAFMAGGKIPNMLMPIVDKALKGGKGVDEAQERELMEELTKNPEMLQQMMELYDTIAIKCFVEPKLYQVPDDEMLEKWNKLHPDEEYDSPEDLRYDDRLYVDEIPDEDKAYLFQCLSGGVKDLATFRAEQQIDVARLATVSGVAGITVGDDGAHSG